MKYIIKGLLWIGEGFLGAFLMIGLCAAVIGVLYALAYYAWLVMHNFWWLLLLIPLAFIIGFIKTKVNE